MVLVIVLNNFSLMSLFEAGILDRMSNIEYEKMFGVQNVKITSVSSSKEEESNESNVQAIEGTVQKSSAVDKKTQKIVESNKLEPISIEMLQGAFLVLVVGYVLAAMILCFEILEHRYHFLRNIGVKSVVYTQLIGKEVTKLVNYSKRALANLAHHLNLTHY